MNIQIKKQSKTFSGQTIYFEHESVKTKTKMNFSTFVPNGKKVTNAIIWLSGLTCNEENFITKAGVQRYLKDTDTMILCPDTSPRGLNLPNEHETYSFGSGAGFYINASTAGYKEHYQMYDYIAIEVVEILKTYFKIENISIMGHSMGGHGALVIGLREKHLFKSVSAFSPLVNPLESPWGRRAFLGYLGENSVTASLYDATEIIKSGMKRENTILIDQGLDDEFLKEHLLTDHFVKACRQAGQELIVNYREGYDHSYFFISTFLKEHIEFHLENLRHS